MVGIKGKSGIYKHKKHQGFQKGHKDFRKNPIWCKGIKKMNINDFKEIIL